MTWEKAHTDRLCGSCGALVKAETAVLLVTSAKLSRCVRCAKEDYDTEPPMTWPVSTDPGRAPTFVPARRLAAKAKHEFDAKMAQAGD